jgi:hypothetical protein
MMVILESSLFATPRLVDLLPFLWLGAVGRHRVVVDDDQGAAYRSWLAQLNPDLHNDWVSMIHDGYRLNASHPSHHEIRVSAIPDSRWSQTPPVLTVGDALEFLHRPYRILVENGHADRAFLLCLCTEEQRRFLEERVAKEWAEMEHCGGIGHLGKRAEELRKHARSHMRTSAVFDSDALSPGKPNATSSSVQRKCGAALHHHQLLRRAIENYVPRVALERWCKLKQGAQRRERQEIMEALFSLSAEQRAHYNMKEGFERDAPRAGEAGTLYEGIPSKKRYTLKDGLGTDVATLYAEGYVAHHELEDDITVKGAKRFVAEIIERVR